jgi:hypothetical protein
MRALLCAGESHRRPAPRIAHGMSHSSSRDCVSGSLTDGLPKFLCRFPNSYPPPRTDLITQISAHLEQILQLHARARNSYSWFCPMPALAIIVAPWHARDVVLRSTSPEMSLLKSVTGLVSRGPIVARQTS